MAHNRVQKIFCKGDPIGHFLSVVPWYQAVLDCVRRLNSFVNHMKPNSSRHRAKLFIPYSLRRVMKVLARAWELEAEGRKIMHLEVGQPKTGAPSKVIRNGHKREVCTTREFLIVLQIFSIELRVLSVIFTTESTSHLVVLTLVRLLFTTEQSCAIRVVPILDGFGHLRTRTHTDGLVWSFLFVLDLCL